MTTLQVESLLLLENKNLTIHILMKMESAEDLSIILRSVRKTMTLKGLEIKHLTKMKMLIMRTDEQRVHLNLKNMFQKDGSRLPTSRRFKNL